MVILLPRNHNLRILETYKNTFQLHTGLSDHYIGNEMLYMSIALRAKILEKGIYTNSNMLEHDISFTASISELDAILKNINSCWLAMGEPLRDLSQKNMEIKAHHKDIVLLQNTI